MKHNHMPTPVFMHLVSSASIADLSLTLHSFYSEKCTERRQQQNALPTTCLNRDLIIIIIVRDDLATFYVNTHYVSDVSSLGLM